MIKKYNIPLLAIAVFLLFLKTYAEETSLSHSADVELSSYREHHPPRHVMAVASQFAENDFLYNDSEKVWKLFGYVASLHITGEYKESTRILTKFIDKQKELLESNSRVKDLSYAMLSHAYAISGLEDQAYQALDEVKFEKPTLGDVLSMAMIYADLDRHDIVQGLIQRISFDDLIENVEEYNVFDVHTYIALLLELDEADRASKLLNELEQTTGSQSGYYRKYLKLKIALATSDSVSEIKESFEEFEKTVNFLPIIPVERN